MKVSNERDEKVIMSTHFDNSIFMDYISGDINGLGDLNDVRNKVIEIIVSEEDNSQKDAFSKILFTSKTNVCKKRIASGKTKTNVILM